MVSGCRPRRVLALAIVLLGSFLLKLHHLGHLGLSYFDESFHAIVARNLLKYPLRPTLIDEPWVPSDVRNWSEGHVWLHKPILPLWQIAGSYALLGVNTFALRLPSALLGTGAVWLTFLIGAALFDHRTGLIAAALQAVNPAMTMLVHGYLFSDHIDVALLFWVELAAYFLVRAMKSGAWHDVLLAGVAQGLAFLSKSYLAAIVSGLAATAWLLPAFGIGGRDECRVRLRHLVGLLAATVATVAPWTIYCLAHYPREFSHEHGYVWTHLGTGVENWGGPWDRVIFDYLITLYHVFYTPVLVAALALLGRAVARRQASLWFTYAWVLGVLAPHVVAATKTPTATLIVMPASFLLLGHLISEALEGGGWPLASWVGIMAISLVAPAPIRPWGQGYPDPPVFAGVMRQSLWVLGHVAAAFGVALAIVAGTRLARGWAVGRPRDGAWNPGRALRFVALAGLTVLGAQAVYASWRVTIRNRKHPGLPEIAAFARSGLPPRAVLLFDGRDLGEHHATMFLADRTCYALRDRPVDVLARQVFREGGIPYVVSASPTHPWPMLFRSAADGRAIYQWYESPLASRPRPR